MPCTSPAHRAAALPDRVGKKRVVTPGRTRVATARLPNALATLVLALTSLATGWAQAHTPDWPDRAWSKHGGEVQTIDDFRVELVAMPERLNIYLRDPEGRTVVDEDVSGEVLIWADNGVKKAQLVRHDAHLTAAAPLPATASFRVIVELHVSGKEPLKLLFGPMTLPEQQAER